MNETHARFSPALVESIAGLSAGIASTLAVHPLDVIKTRLQIHRNVSSAPIDSLTILRSLIRGERPVHSLYRGLTPNIVGNASSWACFFYFKSILEAELSLFHRNHGSHQIDGVSSPGSRISLSSQQLSKQHGRLDNLKPLDYFLASGISGLLTTFFTNPIWVIKTRMLSSDATAVGAYPSMWYGARDVWTKEGLKGFYRGVGISCLGVSHGAVQFAVYEPLKNYWRQCMERTVEGGEVNQKLGNDATLAISSLAKIFAGTITYPYQVIRSRLQTYDAEERFGKGIRGVVTKIWREDGLRGFYKGLGPNVVKVLPATWVTFLVYENMRYHVPRLRNSYEQDI